MDRFSEYRVMWVLVFFDLPTDTKKERKASADFRKKLLSAAPAGITRSHPCWIVAIWLWRTATGRKRTASLRMY